MSCDRGFLKNVACAAKSGISKTASRSASIAGRTGKAYVSRMKKNASAIVGAGRNPIGFYKEQLAMNYSAAAVLPGVVKDFNTRVMQAKRKHVDAVSGPLTERRRAFDDLAREVKAVNPDVAGDMTDAATVGAAVYAASLATTTPFFRGYFSSRVTEGDAEMLAGYFSRVLAGASGLGAVQIANERRFRRKLDEYGELHADEEVVKVYNRAHAAHEAALKKANSIYKNTVLSSAQRLALSVRDARQGARVRVSGSQSKQGGA